MAATKQPNAIDVHVGQRVRLRRMILGVGQEKLGDSLGVTFQQVQKYEKGTNRTACLTCSQSALLRRVCYTTSWGTTKNLVTCRPLVLAERSCHRVL